MALNVYNLTAAARRLPVISLLVPPNSQETDCSNELRGLTNAQYTAIAADANFRFQWSKGIAEYTTTGLTVALFNSGSVTPAADALVDANGLAPTLTIYKSFAAGAGGAPDDITVYSANAPFAFRILRTEVLISTLIALSTVQLRSATAGGGSALTDLIISSAVGRGIDPSVVVTATQTVSANGTLVLRRSDNGVAGEVIITLQKI